MARRIGLVAAVAALLLLAWMLFGDGDRADSPRGPRVPASPPTTPAARPEGKAPKEVPPSPEESAGILPGGPATTAAPPAVGPIRVVTNVPGASVTARFLFFGGDPDPGPVTKAADAKGVASFDIPSHPTPLAAVAAGASAAGFAPDREEKGAPVEEIRLDLRRGEPVRGKVIGEDGTPVAGAEVWGGLVVVRTGPDGTFEIVWNRPEVGLKVTHAAFLESPMIEAPVPSSGVEVVLKRGLEIAGRVSFPDGKPVPGARLQSDGVRVQGVADADGRFTLSGLRPGPVEVWCITADQRRTVEAGASTLDFVMENHLLVLRIQDDQGRPFRRAGVSVTGLVKGEETFYSAGGVDENGVEVLSAPAGTTLRVTPSSARGYEKRVTDFLVVGPPSVHEVPIVIRRITSTGSLEVRVRDDAGGRPDLVYMTVENEAGAVEEGWYERKVSLDAEGACLAEGLAPGAIRVRLATDRMFPGEGYGLTTEGVATIDAGKVSRLDILIRSGGRLSVTVLGRDGAVVPPGKLRILDAAGRQVPAVFWGRMKAGWTTSLREAGPAVCGRPLAPAGYTVELLQDDRVIASRPFTLTWRQTTEVELTLDR